MINLFQAGSVFVELTRSARKQLARRNSRRGIRLVSMNELQYELESFIAYREMQHVHLDTSCQELRYDHGIYLLMKKMQGVWYVTDVFDADEHAACSPVYIWQRVRRGVNRMLACILVGWQKADDLSSAAVWIGGI